ncbi:class I SAM-dependent methyltransferase [uncultured Christiangramia sp.]|uniref:class I SAM-dependent methyltransferase n=1 Tax=Christiangramia sp. 3-2217-3z TaxID=3417564 RepID=UPI0026076F2C|nr:class I SAM-dependent methyltransferase [uncultured Christiangramia sp.]
MYLKKSLSPEFKTRLKRKLEAVRAHFYKKDLSRIGQIFKTDKFEKHNYTPVYQKHFHPLRKKKINLLEIGVGGYKNPISGGNSLRMWKGYFRKAKIFAIDIYDKEKLQEKRIKIFKGSQIDLNFLNHVYSEIGKLDIIIDDGSHINEHVITSFKFLFPKLNEQGIYVIEDIQTSYWPEYGGSSLELNNPETIMGFFKSLTDGLNHAELIIPDYKASYLNLNIESIHFYHNMIFIYKGKNTKPSSYLINNQLPEKLHE